MTRLKPLLRKLARMSHSERQRRMVELGRTARDDDESRGTIEALTQGGATQRALALTSCHGSRDGALAARMLHDPSRSVRGLARRVVACVCEDGACRAALDGLHDPRAQLALVKRLAAKGRRHVVDDWLVEQAGKPAGRYGDWLGFGSTTLVRESLEGWIARGLTVQGWLRLTRHHPEEVGAALLRRADAATRREPWLVAIVVRVFLELSRRAPDTALRLLQAVTRHAGRVEFPLQALATRRPRELADWLLASPEKAEVDFTSHVRELGEERIQALLERRPEWLPLGVSWFRDVPADVRLRLFEKLGERWRDAEGCLPPWLLARLPGETRGREARAHWRLAMLAARPEKRAAYAWCLPWAEALEALRPLLGDPDPTLRIHAWAALIPAVQFERARLGELLELIVARKNEQDPVRGTLFSGLASLPVVAWREEHLPSLGQAIEHLLEAADLSNTTAWNAERLLVRLLPRHTTWTLEWIVKIVKRRGRVLLRDLEQRITDDEARRLEPLLLPVLKSWNVREREDMLVVATGSLGRRLRVMPGVLELLEAVVLKGRAFAASCALACLHTHAPRRLEKLVPKLLDKDPSAITLPIVSNYLHLRRQDLLDPYLGRKAFSGRFGTGRTRYVLPIESGFQRWWPEQQATFAETLHELVRDHDRDRPTQFVALRRLGALVDAPVAVEHLRAWAEADQPEGIRDTALRALGRLDGCQGTPYLVESLGDDRGRVAIYALRRALLGQPGESALRWLREAPVRKVTIAKEVARLLGDLRSVEARGELLAWLERPLHRDVRVAVLRGLWEHLDAPESWEALERAADETDPAIGSHVARLPGDGLSADGARRLTRLLERLLRHSDARVRLAALRRCAAEPVRDADQSLAAALGGRLESEVPDEVAAAAEALLATYGGRDESAIGAAVDSLIRAGQPRRRSLEALLHTTWNKLCASSGPWRPTLDVVLASLADQPLLVTWTARLIAAGLSGDSLCERLEALAPRLHAESLMTLIGSLANTDSPDLADWSRVERRLGSSDDERLRRVALAALLQQALRAGWTTELRERLESYRRDPAPLVASAAAVVFPPESTQSETQRDS